MRIKGLARSFDLAQLQSMIQRLSAKVDCLLRQGPQHVTMAKE